MSWSGTVVADITWSAYALAMFTPEQRAAAVQAAYEPPEILQPIPPQTPTLTQSGLGYLVQVGSRLLNPNKQDELQAIHAAGWRYEAGRWIAPGNVGTASTSDQAAGAGGARPSSLSTVSTATSIQGASVLGTIVPVAPPVLLPSFVGGRLGVVRIGGGMRPESGGTPDRVRFGDPVTMPVVRMQDAGGGGGGGSW